MKKSVDNQESIIQMRIFQIVEQKFSINEKVPTMKDIVADNLNMQLRFGLKPDKDNNTFTVTIMLAYKYQVNDIIEDMVSIDVSSIFEIPNIDKFIDLQSDSFNDKAQLVPQMLNIAIGATRGMLAAKVAGTILAKFPMPMIDLEELITNSGSE